MPRRPDPTRRTILQALTAAPLALVLGARLGADDQLPATPACADDHDVTEPTTEGPFFKPSSPLRASLMEAGTRGTRLSVSGLVLSTGCRPVPNALIEFWQADDRGEYDNTGFRLRGHQFTDAQGRYRVDTVVPGLYPGRTRHLHVKVQAPSRPVLTTQLFFPGEARNTSDGIFRRSLLMKMSGADAAQIGTFDFVLKM